LPIMSNAPHTDLQLDREPVLAMTLLMVAHVVEPSSATPGSGVPAAAPCHSRLVRSRFPESKHAWFAWNHVMHRDGCTPATETAKKPGDGGFDPGTAVQFPDRGKFVNTSMAMHADGLSGIAPPAWRSASVTRPVWTFRTSLVFAGSIFQRLASYVSTQVLPTFTESAGHPSVMAWGGRTVASPTTPALTMSPRFIVPFLLSLLPHS